MSFSILKQIGDAQKKKKVVDVRSGDTVKVTQKIKEGDKIIMSAFGAGFVSAACLWEWEF